MPVIPDKEVLLSLAQDLPAVWNSPTADMRLKQRIIRILIEEIVADVDQDKQEVVLLIHWAGGRHAEFPRVVVSQVFLRHIKGRCESANFVLVFK